MSEEWHQTFSICDRGGCPNKGRICDHPRSHRHADLCGMCGFPVRFIKAKTKAKNDEEELAEE